MFNYPQINNDSLRKKLQELGLREDDTGYWYLDSFSKIDWLIASYDDELRVAKKVGVDKYGEGYFSGLGETLYCSDEEIVLKEVNKLLKQVKKLDLTKKKKKMKVRMNKLSKDFK